MTQTLTTKVLNDFITGQGYGVAPSAVEAMARELLANREAQPVAYLKKSIIDSERFDSADPEIILHPNTPEGWLSEYQAVFTSPPAPAVPILIPIELHMGAATSVFNAICDEMISSKVEHSKLGVMGAAKIEVWSSKIGGLLEMRYENGGCTLKVIAASPPAMNGWKLVPIQPTDEMCDVKHIGIDVYEGEAEGGEHYSIGGEDAAKVYRAMLAAAPEGGK